MRIGMFGSKTQGLVRLKSIMPIVLVVLLLVIGVLTGCSQAIKVADNATGGSVPITVNEAMVPALFNENAVVALYENAIQAVVKIQTLSEHDGLLEPSEFYTPPLRGQGSGFIIDGEGHILTNNHVIDGVSEVQVTLHDGRTIDAKVIGTAPENDIALLKVDKDELRDITPLLLGNSDNVKPGQTAIALGSPFGLDGSITIGIVSGLGRSIPSATQRLITGVIQTDAAINPGNSGGPLLNSRGEVIGINTAIEPSSSGIGFAVPINTAKSLLPALIEGGEVRSPWLGIRGVAIDEELTSRLDLSADRGVYVVSVVPGSPAEESGLLGSSTDENGQPTFGGDVITAVDGRVVSEVEDLIAYFNSKKAGDRVSLSVRRGDQALTIEVVLGKWPEQIQ